MTDIITSIDYFYHMKQLNYIPSQIVIDNASNLLRIVNRFLDFLFNKDYLPKTYKIIVNSGWRSEQYNEMLRIKGIARAAVKSRHCTGEAIDIKGIQIIKLCEAHPEILSAFDLYAEHSRSTPSWTHLQTPSPASMARIFYA